MAHRLAPQQIAAVGVGDRQGIAAPPIAELLGVSRRTLTYGVAWIKEYGKGRTYFTPLGHTDIFYTDQRWTQHLLAAIQYILGDLDADATPSGKVKATTAGGK